MSQPVLPDDASRILILGASGSGKSTLVDQLFRAHEPGHTALLNLDPGLSRWAPPTCISLHTHPDHVDRHADALSCVGSLNPIRHQGRFLAEAARIARLIPDTPCVLIDAPGIARGRVAIEFTATLVELTQPSHVLLIAPPDDADALRLQRHLGLHPDVTLITRQPHPSAQALGRGHRRQLRSERWEQTLHHATRLSIPADTLLARGFIPHDDPSWEGRLIALLDGTGRTIGVGLVHDADGTSDDPTHAPTLDVSITFIPDTTLADATTLFSTDTQRDTKGRIGTVPAPRPRSRTTAKPAWTLPDRQNARVPISWPESAGRAPFKPMLLNPLLGDPALMLRERRGGRALLFDIGWLDPLPGKLLHDVSDLFISHAHMDHLQGFIKLLRLLLGPGGSLRIYGPPGIDDRLLALIHGFDFNLVGEGGPVFHVHTYDGGDTLQRSRILCSRDIRVDERVTLPVEDHVLLSEPGLTVRASQLMHSIPVLGFRVDTQEHHAEHRSPHAGPPLHFSLAYVTDIADSPDNRATAIALARDADLFVCESMFTELHRERATATAHLTGRACAEIARDANVRRLVPFHFSPRYSDHPEHVYAEIMATFPNVIPAV